MRPSSSITKTLSTMAADKAIGRSEALRRSMVVLMEHGELQEARPAYWAPFVVVGEGGRTGAISGQPVPAPGKSTKTTRKGRSKENEPWTIEIWNKQ